MIISLINKGGNVPYVALNLILKIKIKIQYILITTIIQGKYVDYFAVIAI